MTYLRRAYSKPMGALWFSLNGFLLGAAVQISLWWVVGLLSALGLHELIIYYRLKWTLYRGSMG